MKENLRESGMSRRDQRRMAEENANAAEKACANTSPSAVQPSGEPQRRGSHARKPDRQNHREDSNDASDDAMREFVANPADQRRNDPAVGERPIGNGIGGVVARDERAGHQQQDRAARRERRRNDGRRGFASSDIANRETFALEPFPKEHQD